MRRYLVLTLIATTFATIPGDVDAQRRRNPSYGCCSTNRFYLEPYGGAFKDAYDVSPDDDIGYQLGLRVGYDATARMRLVGNVNYSYAGDVSDPGPLTSYYVYDNVWVMTTGGFEFDVVPGNTSAALGVQAGVAWRKVELDETIGTPPGPAESSDSFSSYEVVIPGLTLRHRLNSRATLVLGIYDHIFDVLEGPAQHSPALTIGASFR